MINIPQNFYRETIAQDLAIGTGNVYVSAIPSVSQGYLTISPSSSTLREIIFFTSTGTDSTGPYVVVSSAGHRGIGGTTEQTHIIGEPVRMNVGAETIQEISDDIDAIVAAGAADASTTTKGIVKLNATPTSASEPIAVSPNGIVFETTAGATHSLTTVAGEKVIVWAKGSLITDATIGGAANSSIITLSYNSVTKDTVVFTDEESTNNNYIIPFSLMYTETPGASTANVVVANSDGSLQNVVIIVLKIKI